MLKSEGLKPYLDIENIPVGEWPDEIERAISRVSHFIVFISENARNSGHVMKEVDTAIKYRAITKLEIFPIWISEIKEKHPLDCKVNKFNGIVLDSINPFLLRQKLIDYLSPQRKLFESIRYWLAFILIFPPLIILLSPPDLFKLIFMLITTLLWLAYQLFGFKLRNTGMIAPIVTLLLTLTLLSGGYAYFGKDKIQAEKYTRQNLERNIRIKESINAITDIWHQLDMIQKGGASQLEKSMLENGNIDFKFHDRVAGQVAIFAYIKKKDENTLLLNEIRYYKKYIDNKNKDAVNKDALDHIASDVFSQDRQNTLLTRIIFEKSHNPDNFGDEPHVIHRLQLDLKKGRHLELTETAPDQTYNNLKKNIKLLIGDLSLCWNSADSIITNDQAGLLNLTLPISCIYGP